MSYLVDTNAWIGFFEGREGFGEKAKKTMIHESESCFISIASIWEAAIKVGIGKLKLHYDLQFGLPGLIEENGFQLLPVEFDDAVAVENLPGRHGDPFDRIMAVQAARRAMRIISRDPVFDQYGLRRIW